MSLVRIPTKITLDEAHIDEGFQPIFWIRWDELTWAGSETGFLNHGLVLISNRERGQSNIPFIINSYVMNVLLG